MNQYYIIVIGFFYRLNAVINRILPFFSAFNNFGNFIQIVFFFYFIQQRKILRFGGNYYFKIASFPNYGKLANLDMQGLRPGARIAADEYEKDSVSDFALWKAWDEADGNTYWETEIGKGRHGQDIARHFLAALLDRAGPAFFASIARGKDAPVLGDHHRLDELDEPMIDLHLIMDGVEIDRAGALLKRWHREVLRFHLDETL